MNVGPADQEIRVTREVRTNTGKVNVIMMLAGLFVISGCATTAQPGYIDSKPILSAAEARSMVRVEVKVLEPLPIERAVAAATLKRP